MKNRAKNIRLGIFIVLSSTILLFLIAYFTAKEMFEKTDTYYVAFKEVSVGGMEVGSPVNYLGINVGTISDIHIDPEDITKVEVEISIEAGTPVKEDSKANIISLGITGKKAIEIHGGSNEADFLPPGGYINPGSTLSSELIGKAEILAEKAEKILNNLQQFTHTDTLSQITQTLAQFRKMAENADKAILRMDTIVIENKDDLRETLLAANKVSESLVESSQMLKENMTQIDQTIKGDSIADIVGNILEVTRKIKESNITQLIDDLARVVGRTQELILKVDGDIDSGTADFVESQGLLKSTLRNLDEASRKINDNPSLLIRKSNTKGLPDKQLND